MKSVIRIATAFLLVICFLSTSLTGLTASALGLEIAPSINENNVINKNDNIQLESNKVIDALLPGINLRPERPPLVDDDEEEEEEEEPVETLPSEYCLRDDYIVYAQHQDKNGLCWNFAATMAASTTIMKATNEYYDFSEAWTALTSYTPKKYCSTVGAGGTFTYQYNAIQNNGLMLETDLPYQNSYIMSNENANDYYDFYSQYSNNDISGTLISDSSTSYSRKDVDKIKSHIYNNGSLYLAFTFKTGFLEENGVYSLTPNQKGGSGNHAVSLIGWDDNYEKEFYLDGSDTPTVFKGAWIILNSYTETSGTDGISLIFYEDTNIYQVKGYRYEKDTTKKLYFYDKIESGYAYPTNVKGKYYGDLAAETAPTKQLNIFYDDVNLEYSYEISSGAKINGIEIYLNNQDVTRLFNVRIDSKENKFYISGDDAAYGQYKVLVRYGNGEESDTYLNNFFVTYGLAGEELEFDNEKNDLSFDTGRELEYYSYINADKNYVIYTDKLSGSLSFLPIEQSVYSDKNMSIPTLHYEIKDGKSCTVTHKISSSSGYELVYTFTFVYCADTSMQQVTVYYDLNGGVNHSDNNRKELANENNPLTLYAPTRAGYTFVGWYVEGDEGLVAVQEIDGLYTVDWDDIHHMGTSPTTYAKSYYTKYYNNTNILFVHAVWEKAEYTATWQDWNGAIIGSEKYFYGEIPTYSGTAPTKPEDERYTYVFTGWSPATNSSFEALSYIATYDAIPKQYTITVTSPENGSVTADNTGTLTCLDSRTYVFTANEGYEISDVKINGVSVGAVTAYTFTEVTANQSLEVEFVKTGEWSIPIVLAISIAYVTVSGIAAVILLSVQLNKKEAKSKSEKKK